MCALSLVVTEISVVNYCKSEMRKEIQIQILFVCFGNLK